MKCLDNLIQYNIDHVKAIAEVLKIPSSSRGSKIPGNSRGFKNIRQ